MRRLCIRFKRAKRPFMSEDKQSFEAGCHCGTVRFRFVTSVPVTVTDCNCSLCAMTGYQHVFIPLKDLEFLNGRDDLTSYKFGTRTADHLFCAICGIKPLYRPRSHPNHWSVNARCVNDLEVNETVAFDGRNWESNIDGLHNNLSD